ncbi:MAG: response regulator [Candidatus Wallbacteria bacterium]|nr:response regulator [Candidatus Wallbacteria bacterium]
MTEVLDLSGTPEVSAGRVLVVDDEERNRRLLGDLLEVRGHEVTFAEDGREAIERAQASPQDVILLDVMLPDLDGYEVCRQLKSDSRTGHVPILLVTALKERTSRLLGIQAGASDFLTKPIDPEDLRLRVRNAVHAKRLFDRVQTDLIRLQELESQRKMLTRMLVHDMRTPLTGIGGFLELALMDKLPKEAAECVASALRSTEGLVEMVSSILDVGRMEEGHTALDLSEVEVRSLADRSLARLEPLKKGRTLTIASPRASTRLTCDAHLIQRVIQNLLGNALKFTDSRKGTIALGIEAREVGVKVTVEDNGPGIPPEYRDKVFDMYFQASSRRQNLVYSTGLGLTFCKLAVEAHGGQIGVESQVGKGSAFWFELPWQPCSRGTAA